MFARKFARFLSFKRIRHFTRTGYTGIRLSDWTIIYSTKRENYQQMMAGKSYWLSDNLSLLLELVQILLNIYLFIVCYVITRYNVSKTYVHVRTTKNHKNQNTDVKPENSSDKLLISWIIIKYYVKKYGTVIS